MSAELEMQLRLQYAMTIVRLVNGISDSSQKGKVATSVAVLATKSGMAASPQCVRCDSSTDLSSKELFLPLLLLPLPLWL